MPSGCNVACGEAASSGLARRGRAVRGHKERGWFDALIPARILLDG